MPGFGRGSRVESGWVPVVSLLTLPHASRKTRERLLWFQVSRACLLEVALIFAAAIS